MTVLSDRDIIRNLDTNHLNISSYNDNNLTPNGYDLCIGEVSIYGENNIYKEGIVKIPSKTMFYVSTIEYIKMADDICAQLWLRTSWMRKGVISSFGKIDAGFEGTLTIGAFNATNNTIEIPIGERFCQIVFESLTSPSEKNYEGRSGHYQRQKGISLNPSR